MVMSLMEIYSITLVLVLLCTSYIRARLASHKAIEQLERWNMGALPI